MIKKNRGFTLIEILVVATTLGILATVGLLSYSSLVKNSRDARRKTDLEQIRAAIELYRSNNTGYPSTISSGSSLCDPAGCPPDGNIYLQKVPADPKPDSRIYYYSSTASDYTLAAELENTSACESPPGGNSCGTNAPCNYCLGPYGEK